MLKIIPRFITNSLRRLRNEGQPVPQPAVIPPPPSQQDEQEWMKRIRRINELCEQRKRDVRYDQRPN